MDYKVTFKSSVKRDLKKISKTNLVKIFVAIGELKANPYANPKLRGRFEGLRKYRVGDFRIIYTILENEILILRISNRKEVYRKN